MTATIAMLSCWRNDEARNLEARAAHLLSKTYPGLRWVWVVSDSDDLTYAMLQRIMRTHLDQDITVVDLHRDGPPPKERMRRFGSAAQAGIECVQDTDAAVLIHESDLISPPDVVERFLAVGGEVVAGWPVLGDASNFYDIWAYRGLDGRHFTNTPPYHPSYRPDAPFEVSSVGSCWLLPAAAVRDGIRCDTFGAVELCAGLRRRGYRIWVDPTIEIVQPLDLWTAHAFPSEPVGVAE